MPNIADKFSQSYEEHNGNIVETLADLKGRTGEILDKKGLFHYEKPAEKAID